MSISTQAQLSNLGTFPNFVLNSGSKNPNLTRSKIPLIGYGVIRVLCRTIKQFVAGAKCLLYQFVPVLFLLFCSMSRFLFHVQQSQRSIWSILLLQFKRKIPVTPHRVLKMQESRTPLKYLYPYSSVGSVDFHLTYLNESLREPNDFYDGL